MNSNLLRFWEQERGTRMPYPPPAPKYVGPPAHDSGNGNKPITRIVIHCTAGSDGKGAMGTANYFKQKSAGGSAHYVIDSDEVLQTAYDSVVCWHAPPNTHSLGVEMCCSLADKGKGHWERADHVSMMRLTATLTAELCLAYNIPAMRLSVADVKAGKKGICGHVDVSNAFKQSSHWDPGPYFPWAKFMAMVLGEITRITTGKKPPAATPQEPSVSDIYDAHVHAKAAAESLEDAFPKVGMTPPTRPAVTGSGDAYFAHYWAKHAHNMADLLSAKLDTIGAAAPKA